MTEISEWESEGGRLIPFRMRDVVGRLVSSSPKKYSRDEKGCGTIEGLTKTKINAALKAHNTKVGKLHRKNWSIVCVYSGYNSL